MKATEQMNFWQLTMTNAKEAVRLYFQPVRQVGAWLDEEREPIDVRRLKELLQQESLRVEELREELGRQKESTDVLLRKLRQNQDALEVRLRDVERQLNPPFDSLGNLDLTVKRIAAWLGTPAGSGRWVGCERNRSRFCKADLNRLFAGGDRACRARSSARYRSGARPK